MQTAADTATPPGPNRNGLGALLRRLFVEIVLPNRVFIGLLIAGFVGSALIYQNFQVAAWVGFLFAAYAAVANDSIQTIGTFIASNRKTKWYWLWLFIGSIFVVTVFYSWYYNDGDVAYGRLDPTFDENGTMTKGYPLPKTFAYLQVVAPLVLVLLTRLRMPVSTTFLLLTSFALNVKTINIVLLKSLSGYVVAFACALLVWGAIGSWMNRVFIGEPHPGWRVAQWITSGILWSVWVQQDAANIAVYLPRQMNLLYFVGFAAVVFVGLGILFKSGGERIQQVVDEKSAVIDVRPATIIDLVYAIILFVFKEVSEVPMSTTWVFLGLLGGREVALSLKSISRRDRSATFKLIGRDVLYAFAGLAVSIALAALVNQRFASKLLELFGVTAD